MLFDRLVFRSAERRAATYSFANGYAASVVSMDRHPGRYEVAVLHGGRLVYDTPVTHDVRSHLTPGEVSGVMSEIAALPPR